MFYVLMSDKNKLNNSCALSGTRLLMKINEPCFETSSQLLITHPAKTRFVFSLYTRKREKVTEENEKNCLVHVIILNCQKHFHLLHSEKKYLSYFHCFS